MGLSVPLPSNLRLYQSGDIGGFVAGPDEAIYRGPIGEWVRLIEPETEASPAALCISALATAGAYIGRGVKFEVGRVTHRSNVNAAIVGDTSTARKGTALMENARLWRDVDPDFLRDNFISGIASGPSLVRRLSDPIEDKTGEIKHGKVDQRALWGEGEFSLIIRNASRDGANLSEQIRNAYDGKRLENDAISSGQYQSTNHCLSILGACTPGELTEVYSSPAATTGFANRFLYVWSYSDKRLPDGGEPVDCTYLAEIIRRNVTDARRSPILQRASAAGDWWHEVYAPIADGADITPDLRPLLARRTDYIAKLAHIYAVTEGAFEVGLSHMKAGKAWTDYCTQTVRAVLGGLVRDPTVGKVLASLRSHPGHPVLRSELHQVFGRNATGSAIEAALMSLVNAGLAFTWIGEASERGGPRPHLAVATTPLEEVANVA